MRTKNERIAWFVDQDEQNWERFSRQICDYLTDRLVQNGFSASKARHATLVASDVFFSSSYIRAIPRLLLAIHYLLEYASTPKDTDRQAGYKRGQFLADRAIKRTGL